MLKALLTRIRQGRRTIPFPAAEPMLPERYRGRPRIDAAKCPDGCCECAGACPTDAIEIIGGKPRLDLGRCLFCPECAQVCPEGAIEFTPDYRMAFVKRDDMILGEHELELARAVSGKIHKLFGRSLKLRQVSAGGCGACEADVNVLNTITYDLGRFGIEFVASPRHADGLLVTGAITRNMELALRKTWEAVPSPKVVIAVGACAVSGGPYAGHDEVLDGAGNILPVDLYIPGCPPHPLTILDGLLRWLGKRGESPQSTGSVVSD